MDDDVQFEGIWKYHEDVHVPNPEARVPFGEKGEAFLLVLHREREARGGNRTLSNLSLNTWRTRSRRPGLRGIDQVPAPHGPGLTGAKKPALFPSVISGFPGKCRIALLGSLFFGIIKISRYFHAGTSKYGAPI